jgi:hypothetical protein
VDLTADVAHSDNSPIIGSGRPMIYASTFAGEGLHPGHRLRMQQPLSRSVYSCELICEVTTRPHLRHWILDGRIIDDHRHIFSIANYLPRADEFVALDGIVAASRSSLTYQKPNLAS